MPQSLTTNQLVDSRKEDAVELTPEQLAAKKVRITSFLHTRGWFLFCLTIYFLCEPHIQANKQRKLEMTLATICPELSDAEARTYLKLHGYSIKKVVHLHTYDACRNDPVS